MTNVHENSKNSKCVRRKKFGYADRCIGIFFLLLQPQHIGTVSSVGSERRLDRAEVAGSTPAQFTRDVYSGRYTVNRSSFFSTRIFLFNSNSYRSAKLDRPMPL